MLCVCRTGPLDVAQGMLKVRPITVGSYNAMDLETAHSSWTVPQMNMALSGWGRRLLFRATRRAEGLGFPVVAGVHEWLQIDLVRT